MQLATSLVGLICGHYALRRRANEACSWSGMAAWPIPSVGIGRDTSLRSTSPERPVLTLRRLAGVGYCEWMYKYGDVRVLT